MTAILGISAFYHDSAACIVVDGEIVAAAQEERFTRKKHDPAFPARAIEYCVREAALRPDDLDYVVFYEKPLRRFERLIETMFTLAADGKVNRKGMPSPLRLAVIANHHFGDVRLPFPPAWLQRLGLLLAAPLGRLVGFRPTYEAADPSTPPALGI